MKLRIVALALMVGGLTAAGVHVATADDRPPASWERDNPARCPFPDDHKTPPCLDLPTPDTGSRPYLGTQPGRP